MIKILVLLYRHFNGPGKSLRRNYKRHNFAKRTSARQLRKLAKDEGIFALLFLYVSKPKPTMMTFLSFAWAMVMRWVNLMVQNSRGKALIQINQHYHVSTHSSIVQYNALERNWRGIKFRTSATRTSSVENSAKEKGKLPLPFLSFPKPNPATITIVSPALTMVIR